MELSLLLAGSGLVVAALLVVLLVVLRPRNGSLPMERRRLNFQPGQTGLNRISQSAATAVGRLIGDSGGFFSKFVLYNAGVKTSPADFTLTVAGGALFLAVVGSLLSNFLIGVLLGVAVPIVVRFVLSILTDKRRAKFESQLTDTIQMIIGGLRVGHSVMRSLDAAGSESESPTSEELTRVVNETRIGKDPQVALDEAADRMGSEDFRWIGQAIQINREVGGDLAGVLEQVASTIRERSEIRGQIRSLSAEGKMSAYVLVALPVGVALVLGVINPGYLTVFVAHPVGLVMLVGAILMFAVGGFWMSRIIKIKF